MTDNPRIKKEMPRSKEPQIMKVRKRFHVIDVLLDLWRDNIYDEYQQFLIIRNGIKKIKKEVEKNEKMQKHRATS